MDKGIFRDKRLPLIMFASFVWGLVAHGVAMFNKYAYHDEALWIDGFNYDDTYGIGRWGRALLGELITRIFGSRHSSTPAFIGFITIACIAAILYLICLRLRIENRTVIVLLAGVMVCFPAITGMFGFFFVCAYFYFGAFLGVLGAYIYYTNKNIKTFLICTTLMMLSTSLYQANIPIDMTVLLLFMLDDVYESDMDWKEYFILGVKNAVICVVFFVEYFLLNKLALSIVGMEMSGYKGVGEYGMTGVAGYLYRVYTAYKRFVKPADYIGTQGVSANMFPWNLKYPHILLILVSTVMIVIFIKNLKNTRKILQISIIMAISPFFAYFIYFMCGEPEVHGLMTYAECLMFVFPAYVMERMKDKGTVIKALNIPVIALMMLICFVLARYDNVCYLKAEVMQTEAISYYNRLISRIEATDGYTSETPVLYVEEFSKNDEDFSGEKLFDPIYLPPYQGRSIINDYSWKQTMDLWCGFDPQIASEEEEKNVDANAIAQMPSYPENGSIKMVGDVLVVKFSD